MNSTGATSSPRSVALTLQLPAILLVAFGLRVWNLDQQGWGADYYSAAVFSMLQSWHNLLFVAFDPAGYISVDKPPLALWLQVVSAKVFGFGPKALLWPQVMMGVVIVWVTWRIVERAFDRPTAIIGAWLMAVTPVLVAVNRSNNTDTCLLLLLLLASWLLLVALERSGRRHWLLAMVLLGLAFNTKMLAGLLVLPLFVLMYLMAAPMTFRQRLMNLLLGLVVLLAVMAPWFALIELTDASQRPYVGSSRNNSVIELVIGHNARSRLERSRPTAANSSLGTSANGDATAATRTANQQPDPQNDGQAGEGRMVHITPEPGQDSRATAREVASRLFVRAAPGVSRLLSGQPAAQVGWMLPFVVLGIGLAVLSLRGSDRTPTQTDVRSGPVKRHAANAGEPQRRQKLLLLLFTGWLLTYAIIYSLLGGIVHFYYLSTLAPAVAVLAATAIRTLWPGSADHHRGAWLGSFAVVATAGWQFWVQYSAMGWSTGSALWSQREIWLNAAHYMVMLMVVLALIRPWLWTRVKSRRLNGLLATALLAGLSVLPMIWSLSSVVVPSSGILPSADLYRWQAATRDSLAFSALRFGKGPPVERLNDFLVRQQQSETYLLSTSTTQWAAPLILRSGQPVMARGGYHGLDVVTDVPRLKALVEQGRLRYLMLDDVGNVSRRLGADTAGQPVAQWIRTQGRVVDPSLWRDPGMRNPPTLYDLRP